MNYVWIFELFWVLKITRDFGNVWVFELFWVIKTAYVFLEHIVGYSIDIWKTDYFLNHLWYICQIKVCDLFATYYFKTMKLLSYFWKLIVYYNFWRLILHLITLQIYCLIELIRTLVTYWVVNSLPFSPPVSDCEE